MNKIRLDKIYDTNKEVKINFYVGLFGISNNKILSEINNYRHFNIGKNESSISFKNFIHVRH